MGNPLQTAFFNQSATVLGFALRKAYEKKMAKYGDSCKEAGMVFRPLPMDTLGGWSNTMVAKVIRVAVVLARINAAMILNRRPVYTSTHVDGLN